MLRRVPLRPSTVLLKQGMALTGLLLFGFVVVHMLGNLNVFLGRTSYNAYAAGLQALGPLLWAARLGLLVVFLLHVATAFLLVRRNQAARPHGYARLVPLASSYASRTMPISGLVVLLFVLAHLLHFTFGAIHPQPFALRDEAGRHDVYNMVVLGFRHAPTTILYVAAMLVLGLHLAHGLAVVAQTLGLRAPRHARVLSIAGWSLAAVVVAGNVAMPLACLFGLVEPVVLGAGR